MTREEIINIFDSARLSISEDEIESFQDDISAILKFTEVLDQLDTEGVEGLEHVSEQSMLLREDEELDSITREEALKNSELTTSRYFLIDGVLD